MTLKPSGNPYHSMFFEEIEGINAISTPALQSIPIIRISQEAISDPGEHNLIATLRLSNTLTMCRTQGNLTNFEEYAMSKIDTTLPNTPTKEECRKRKFNFSPKFSLSASSSDSVCSDVKGLELLNEHFTEHKASKNVSFDPMVRVVLIPKKEEYFDAKIAHRVWYNQSELASMEKEAILSISLGHFYDNSKDEAEDAEYGDCSQVYPVII